MLVWKKYIINEQGSKDIVLSEYMHNIFVSIIYLRLGGFTKFVTQIDNCFVLPQVQIFA